MAKRHRTWNEQKYRRYIKEGRGQGTLSTYKPWIMIHDFPSLGMVSRVLGNTTGRIHHLLSNMELSYFYILDWSDKVCDIREQYPLLDIAAVLEIADKAGIRYPFDNLSGFPYVLTSDFLITTPSGEMVRSIKKKKDLDNLRVREKLELERRYWAKYGVDWKRHLGIRRFLRNACLVLRIFISARIIRSLWLQKRWNADAGWIQAWG